MYVLDSAQYLVEEVLYVLVAQALRQKQQRVERRRTRHTREKGRGERAGGGKVISHFEPVLFYGSTPHCTLFDGDSRVFSF